MTDIGRRGFLAASGLALAAGGVGRADSPSERVRLAVVGLRSRGHELAQNFSKVPGVEVVALCDVDENVLGKRVESLAKSTGKTPRAEPDFRRLLDDKSIDAVAVATPDHWHALIGVMACQAGKDAYVEKPVSYNVVEGRRLVEAARKYKKVVQGGIQRRSTPHVIDAIAHVKSGALGKVALARGWIIKRREPIGRGTVGPVPAGVDYAMWQGPAPDRPFIDNRFHYNWHWFWNWGTGELGNNGIHAVDVCRWGLGVDAPVAVTSGGGKFVFDDDQEVPDTQMVTWEFPDSAIVWEHRMWSRHNLEQSDFGMAFYGDKGTLIVDSKGWRVEDGPAASGTMREEGQSLHFADFIDCIRTRNAPNGEVELAHLSTRLCHLGNIAHRVGRKLHFDAATESFGNDPEANALLNREYSRRFEMPSQV